LSVTTIRTVAALRAPEKKVSPKCLCITGADPHDVETVAGVLRQAGMNAPQPARRDTAVDVAFWHDAVIASVGEAARHVSEPIASPGRLWDQLASDIFLANIESKLWGWADARSTWLLDYWFNFEPGLKFILVCTAPEQMLARLMASDSETVALEALFTEWRASHERMFRFYHRNARHCLLVDARDCAANPAEFMECCRTRWNLPLADATDIAAAPPARDTLAFSLAHQIVRDYPQALALQRELETAITRLGKEQGATDDHPRRQGHLGISHLARTFRRVASTAGIAWAELRAQFNEAVRTHAQEPKIIEMKLAASARENEILLSRLDQTQEELEAAASESESRKCQIEELRTVKAKLDQELSAFAARSNELQKEVQTLTQARDEQAALAARNEAERKTRTEALEAAQVKLKEAEQENELLFLQLHQVQEELEHYFLKHQDAQRELAEAHARWDRMLRRNPDYCDYEAIEITTNAVIPDSDPESSKAKRVVIPDNDPESRKNGTRSAITWRITNLSAASRTLPELHFKTVVERGVAGFVLTREPNTTGPLVRWPARAANRNEVALVPAGDRQHLEEQIEILLDLATADWDFLKALVGVVRGALDSPTTVKLPKGRAESLRDGLAKLEKIIERFSATLRYDRVSLKREQVNADYEHLWLHLDNLAMGSRRWPQFEFRFSCANVTPESFGNHPKLEFPQELGKAPFENWFVESHDDFGAKLELRFALPESIDLAVWQRLSANDRVFLKALIARLPAILAALQADGVKLARPWKAWIVMAHAVQRVLALRSAAPSVPAPATAAPAAISDVAARSRERPAKRKAKSGNGHANPKAKSGNGYGKKPLLKATRAPKAARTNSTPKIAKPE